MLKSFKIKNIILAVIFLFTIFIYRKRNQFYRRTNVSEHIGPATCLKEEEEEVLDEVEDDLSDFFLNPKYTICGTDRGSSLLFIAFVIISPELFARRNDIRNTWGNKQFSSEINVIFIVGFSKNKTNNRNIKKEFQIHRDLLQVNLTDSYHVCTIKIMKSLKWIANYCPNAKYIMKICDDVIVNTPLLLNAFKSKEFQKYEKNHIFGYILQGIAPERGKDSKWHVSEKEFNGTYPDYPQGFNVIFCLLFC